MAEMKQFDPQFKELQQAIVSRPEGRWPVKYEENFGCLVPHLAVLKDIVLASVLRTAAHLELRQGQEAFEDLKVAAAVSDSVKTDPILITHVLPVAMLSLLVDALGIGLARIDCSDEQLQ